MTVVALRFSQCPLGLEVETVDPSLMVDRSLILTLGLSNPGEEFVRFDRRSLQVQAKAEPGWIAVTNLWVGETSVSPRGKALMLVLVPQETEACRLTMNYSAETPKERLARFLRDRAPKVVANFPALRNWLWPPRAPGWILPPRQWTEADFEVRLPQKPDTTGGNVGSF
jgi:hypothetical protein